jgi:plastocyanin
MKKTLLASLLILAVILSGCASPASPTSAPAGATNAPAGTAGVPVTGNQTKIDISHFAFAPATVTVKAGETVQWTNDDSVAHTVVADDNSWQSSNMAKGESFSHTFDTAGTFTYHCSIHPTMKATVIVTP